MKLVNYLILSILFCPLFSLAQPEVIVRASKIEKSQNTLTGSATVIESMEIEASGAANVSEVLRQTVGMQLKKVGGPGQYSYFKIRGFSSNSFIILVDGVSINSQLVGNGNTFLGQIDPQVIDRIEVLRGPQAVTHGANGAVGVIAITTKSGNQSGSHAGIELGSLGWKKGWVGTSGDKGRFGYSLNLSAIDSDGPVQHEAFQQLSPHLNFRYIVGAIALSFSYLQMRSRSDYADLLGGHVYEQFPDKNQFIKREEDIASIKLSWNLNRSLQYSLIFSEKQSRLSMQDKNDGVVGSYLAPSDQGNIKAGEEVIVMDFGDGLINKTSQERLTLENQLRWKMPWLTSLVGWQLANIREIKETSWSSWVDPENTRNRVTSLFWTAEGQFLDDGLTVSMGSRFDDSSRWDTSATGSVGLSYRFYRLGPTGFVNYGTSFNAPELDALAPGAYSNPNLTPSRGRTVEVGIRDRWDQGRWNFELTLFQINISDFIIFNSDGLKKFDPITFAPVSPEQAEQLGWEGRGLFVNGERKESEGAELSLSFDLDLENQFHFNHTYLEGYQTLAGKKMSLVQVAKHTFSLGYQLSKISYSLGTIVHYVGQRWSHSQIKKMAPYYRWDVYSRRRLGKNFEVYGRIENLTNRKIEEGISYKKIGLQALAGLKAKF